MFILATRRALVVACAILLNIACLYFFSYHRNEPEATALDSELSAGKSSDDTVEHFEHTSIIKASSLPREVATGAPTQSTTEQPTHHFASAIVEKASSTMVPDNKTSANAGVTLIINGLQYKYLTPFLERIRAGGVRGAPFTGLVVVLVPHHLFGPVTSYSLQQAWPSKLGPLEISAGDASPASRGKVFDASFFPFSGLPRFMQRLSSNGKYASLKILAFVDFGNVVWCSNPFTPRFLQSLDPHFVYAANGTWGYSSSTFATPLSDIGMDVGYPSPCVFVGHLTAFKRFSAIFQVHMSRFSLAETLRRCSGVFRPLSSRVFAELPIGNEEEYLQCRLAKLTHNNTSINREATIRYDKEEKQNIRTAANDEDDEEFMAIVLDVNRFVPDEGDAFGRRCPMQLFTEPLYLATGNKRRAEVLARDNAPVAAALAKLLTDPTHLAIKSVRGAKSSSKNLSDASHCPLGGRSAVVGIAGGYGPDVIEPFVTTFLKRAVHSSSTLCTTLILFVDDPTMFKDARVGWNVVQWVAIAAFPITERPMCQIWDTRMEIYYKWIVGFIATKSSDEYKMLMFVDVRDSLFQADPFDALVNSEMWRGRHSAGSHSDEWILLPPESYTVTAASSYQPGPLRWFELWIESGFGKPYRELLQKSFLSDRTKEPLPIICSGLFLGTFRAMAEMLSVMNALLKPTGCTADQALLTMIAFDGMQMAEFGGDILVANPEFAPFRNGYPRASDVSIKSGRIVNCVGETYAVLHQIEQGRHPWLWNFLLSTVPIRGRATATIHQKVLELTSWDPKNDRFTRHFSSPAYFKKKCAESSPPTQTRRRSDAFRSGATSDRIILDGQHWSVGYMVPFLQSMRRTGCMATVVIIAPHRHATRSLQHARKELARYDPIQVFNAETQEISLPNENEEEALGSETEAPIPASQSFFFDNVRKYIQALPREKVSGADEGVRNASSKSVRVIVTVGFQMLWLQDIFKFIDPSAGQPRDHIYAAQLGHHRHIDSEFAQCEMQRRAWAGALHHLAIFSADIFGAGSLAAADTFLSAIVAKVTPVAATGPNVAATPVRRCSDAAALNTFLHLFEGDSMMHSINLTVWTSELGPVTIHDWVTSKSQNPASSFQGHELPLTLCANSKITAAAVFGWAVLKDCVYRWETAQCQQAFDRLAQLHV